MTEIEELQKKVSKFGKKRGWEKYHAPKNLAMALSVEVAELTEHFQWLSESASRQLDKDKIEEVSAELADIFMYTLLMCDVLDLDLKAATERKISLNEQRFPLPKEKI